MVNDAANHYRASDECGTHVQNPMFGSLIGGNARKIKRLRISAP
jgi:hypothetical protein